MADEETQKRFRAEQIVDNIWRMFYGQGLQVANWHQNGELEPMDRFFESNDWDYTKPILVDETDATEDDGQRFVWVFEVMDGLSTREKCASFVKYILAEYDTCWSLVARQMAQMEHSVFVRGAQRRRLTYNEYRLVMLCRMSLPHSEKVWQSMLAILFNNRLQLSL